MKEDKAKEPINIIYKPELDIYISEKHPDRAFKSVGFGCALYRIEHDARYVAAIHQGLAKDGTDAYKWLNGEDIKAIEDIVIVYTGDIQAKGETP